MVNVDGVHAAANVPGIVDDHNLSNKIAIILSSLDEVSQFPKFLNFLSKSGDCSRFVIATANTNSAKVALMQMQAKGCHSMY